jgi:hypothetical protein
MKIFSKLHELVTLIFHPKKEEIIKYILVEQDALSKVPMKIVETDESIG